MRRGGGGVPDRLTEGVWPALVVSGAAFLLGGLVGCLLAAYVDGMGSDALKAYLEGFLNAAGEGAVGPPALLPTVWQVLRWPLMAAALGFTALGVLGIPILFAARGFLLSFSIAAFVRMFGDAGRLLAFLVFGVPGCVAVPVFFVLGVQGQLSARRLALRGQGEGKRSGFCGRAYLVRCGLCACALGVCVLLEYLAVPALVAGLSASLLI